MKIMWSTHSYPEVEWEKSVAEFGTGEFLTYGMLFVFVLLKV